ncbi:hypothetical protein HZA57_08280, partial [Candidatus Poribacteria bacterium]|nr:hypothetical protein [Candidatus Poribacteria bacterium]
HLDRALAVIAFGAAAPHVRPPHGPGTAQEAVELVSNPFFRVRMLDVAAGESRGLPGDTPPSGFIAVCVEGAVHLECGNGSAHLGRGRTAYVPACCGSGGRATNNDARPARLLLAESREL